MINLINSLLKSKTFKNEFVLTCFENKIYKYIFYSQNIENNNKIYNLLLKYRIKDSLKINYIFDVINCIPIHLGIDNKTKRFKIYISLYNNTFRKSLEMIKKLKKIIGIKEKYFLEKDFYKFDCIGIDISEKGFDLKIYELVKSKNHFIGLPNFIKRKSVKEIGFLKNFTGRRKKFFRFNDFQKLKLFKDNFILDFLNKKNNFLISQKKVKYYCIEGEKKEIYFI